MENILKHEFVKWNSVEHHDSNIFDLINSQAGEYNPQIDINPDLAFIPRDGIWKFKSTNTTEETFLKNYGNPCYTVFFEKLTLVLEKNEDKISIKIFTNQRHRSVGKPYFVKSTSLKFLTYNKKTQCLYYGSIENYHKKRKSSKRLKKNSFSNRPVNSFTNYLNTILNSWSSLFREQNIDKNSLIKNYIYTFLKNCEISENEIHRTNEFTYNGDTVLYKKNLEKKGIKYPNNYEVFIEEFPLPNKKESKKNNNRLIDIMMDRHQIKGGKFKKAFHSIKNFNPYFLKYSISLFGIDKIKSLPDEYIIKILESNNHCSGIDFEKLSKKSFFSKNNPKILDVFKIVVDGEINFQTFRDHLIFFHRLKKYEPDTKWRSFNKQTFVEEHLDFTEKLEQYSRGLFKRFYSEDFISLFKENIIYNQINYETVLLDDSSSYIDESNTQSNCVRSYITNSSSFIVSLRNGEERATLEYRIYKDEKSNKVNANRVQSLGRFNSFLSDDWNKPLSILDEKINSFMSKNNFILPELEVVFKNGIVKKTRAVFKDNSSIPQWEENDFSDVGNYNIYYIYQDF